MHPNLTKWTLASASKFVRDQLDSSIPLWVQGQEINYSDKREWVELYVVGPRTKQLNHMWDQHQMELLLAINSQNDPTNAHHMAELVGKVKSLMSSGPIFVYQYPQEIYVGCYRLRDDIPYPIDGMNFGQVNPTTRINRETVEGHFQMELTR